jgi:outer membrane receptor protein involved in Fe transport
VIEAFGEIRVPLARERRFLRLLQLKGGARYARLSGSGRNAISYSAGLDWTLSSDLSFGATFSTAFRVPNLNELFLGRGRAFPSVADPCGNLAAASNPTVVANCAAQGVPLNMVPAYSFQTPAAIGGNRDLDPERAKSWMVGATLAPRWLPGSSISVEWFAISIRNPIAVTNVATVYDECYRQSNPEFCGFILRDPLNGQLVEVLTPYINQVYLRTSGIDISASHALRVSSTSILDARLAASYLLTFDDKALPSAAERSRVGYIEPAGGAYPRWRFNFRLRLETEFLSRPVSLAWSTRYIGRLRSWRLRDAPTAANAVSIISPTHYHDLVVEARLPRFDLAIGVVNIFDRQPPYYTGAPDTNTDVDTFDVAGRRFFLRTSLSF